MLNSFSTRTSNEVRTFVTSSRIGSSSINGNDVNSNNAQLIEEKEQLLLRMLMMSMQMQRKDLVVKNLLQELQIMHQTSIKQEQFKKMQFQMRRIIDINRQLQNKISIIQKTNRQLEIHKTSTKKNSELQEKMHFLQQKTRKLQQNKIQIEQQLKKVKTQNHMISYRLVDSQSNLQGKIRDFQNQIVGLKSKLQSQKKITEQLKLIIQNGNSEVRQLKENEERIIRSYQERLRAIQSQFHYNQNLKRSQVMASQQKMVLTAQEINRLSEEVKYLRKTLDDLKQSLSRKQQELLNQIKQSKFIQSQLIQFKHKHSQISEQFDRKNHQFDNIVRQLTESKKTIQFLEKATGQVQYNSKQKEQQLRNYRQQNQHLRNTMLSLQTELQNCRVQMRKLKRKAGIPQQCESCKILSSNSMKSIKFNSQSLVNLSELISQTEKLHKSNIKVDTLLKTQNTMIQESMNFHRSIVYENRSSFD